MKTIRALKKSYNLRNSWVTRRATFIPPFKGRKMPLSARLKMSRSAKLRGSNRTGKTHTLESRIKMSVTMRVTAARGPANGMFKDGKTVERRGIRFSADYARWRFDVFTRDKFTCKGCGDKRGGNLIAHHIKPFADYPELRLVVSNGQTLCGDCHDERHYGI